MVLESREVSTKRVWSRISEADGKRMGVDIILPCRISSLRSA
jgi:hypothetical protein